MKTQDHQQDEIATVINQTIGFFVQQYHTNNLTFPILLNTYSLWRKYAYQRMKALPIFKQDPKACNFKFYLQSQCLWLKIFIQKILAHTKSKTSNHPSQSGPPEEMKIKDQILQKYNHNLQIHGFYQQLLQDIIALPYLCHIFPLNKRYSLKPEYSQDIVGFKKQEQVSQKVSTSLINKGFGFIAEKLFTKSFIFQASTLAIRLNPIAMAASFAFAQLISRYRKSKKGQELSEKITQALTSTQKKAENLKNAYEECIGLLGAAVRLGGSAEQQFTLRVKEVMMEDWLQIQKSADEDGWQIIELQDTNEFTQL